MMRQGPVTEDPAIMEAIYVLGGLTPGETAKAMGARYTSTHMALIAGELMKLALLRNGDTSRRLLWDRLHQCLPADERPSEDIPF